MKKLTAAIALLAMAATTPISAANAFDPASNPAEWQEMLQRSLHLQAFQGSPWIMVINATPDELTIVCDGKWELVGSKPHKSVSENPHSLTPWSITPIHAPGDWDGYCKGEQGLLGTSSFNTYPGKLNAGPGNFTSSTLLYFVKK